MGATRSAILKARLLQYAFDAGVGLPLLRWGSPKADGSTAIDTRTVLASQGLEEVAEWERADAAQQDQDHQGGGVRRFEGQPRQTVDPVHPTPLRSVFSFVPISSAMITLANIQWVFA